MTNCTGCQRPVWEAHKTIEEHIACEAAQQEAVRIKMDLDDAMEPKRDNRFTSRGAPNRKNQPTERYRVHTILQSGVGRKVVNPYWVIDTQNKNSVIDEYSSKRAATMHAKQLNSEVK